jgi:peptidoglycan/LPS O-acetylase OafA/YrhL
LSLIFSWQAHRGWLGRAGLHMTVLGIGTCMFIAAAAQTQWKAPRMFSPLLKMGQYSYEIYLTHVFIVFALLTLFVDAGKRMILVPVYFVATILISSAVGALVAKAYSEPMNRLLRNWWATRRQEMSCVIDSDSIVPSKAKTFVAEVARVKMEAEQR